MRQFCLILAFIGAVFALECYNGIKFISGSTIGESTTHCEDAKEYCYNISVRGLVIFDVLKGGCSFWRCLLAQDRCITTVFQGSPASFCCCSQNFCNVADQRGREFHVGTDESSNFGPPIRPEIHRGSDNSEFIPRPQNGGDRDRFDGRDQGREEDRSRGFNPQSSTSGFDEPHNLQGSPSRPLRTRLDDDNSRETARSRQQQQNPSEGSEVIL